MAEKEKFHWEFNKVAEKQFAQLDKPVRIRILKWLDENIEGQKELRNLGKALVGTSENLWRYRVGKYRLIASIQDNQFLVTIVKVGKRNDVYKRKI